MESPIYRMSKPLRWPPIPRRSAGCFDAPGRRSGRRSAAQSDLGELGTLLRPQGWTGGILGDSFRGCFHRESHGFRWENIRENLLSKWRILWEDVDKPAAQNPVVTTWWFHDVLVERKWSKMGVRGLLQSFSYQFAGLDEKIFFGHQEWLWWLKSEVSIPESFTIVHVTVERSTSIRYSFWWPIPKNRTVFFKFAASDCQHPLKKQ